CTIVIATRTALRSIYFEVPLPARQARPIQRSVEEPARRLSQMKARHAGPTCLRAARVERATMFTVGELLKQPMQLTLEDSLQSTENKIPPRSCIHKEPEMMRHQELRQRRSLNTRMHRRHTNEPMAIAMDKGHHQIENSTARVGCNGLQNRQACIEF